MDAMCQLWLLWTLRLLNAAQCWWCLSKLLRLSLCSLSLHPSEALEERKCRCVVSVFSSSSLRLSLSLSFLWVWSASGKNSETICCAKPPLLSTFASSFSRRTLLPFLLPSSTPWLLIVNCAFFSLFRAPGFKARPWIFMLIVTDLGCLNCRN